MADDILPTPENVLGLADDTAQELQNRIAGAVRYALAWGRDGHQGALAARIDDMVQTLSDLNAKLEGKVFPGISETGAYNNVSRTWTQLYSDVSFATDNLPQPASLLDALAAIASNAGKGAKSIFDGLFGTLTWVGIGAIVLGAALLLIYLGKRK